MLTCSDVQTAVPTPSKTHAGVKSKKGMRIGPKIFFSSLNLLNYIPLITDQEILLLNLLAIQSRTNIGGIKLTLDFGARPLIAQE